MKSAMPEGTESTSSDQFPPLEAPVNPDYYRVGPFDQFILTIPQLPVSSVHLVVSPDNQLVLPRGFSPINVAGLSLTDVRRRVAALYRERSSTYTNVSLSLAIPRRVRVRVVGDVLTSGPLVLTAADRVSTAIEIANTPTERLTKTELQEIISRQAEMRRAGTFMGTQTTRLRGIVVRHIDGTADRVDLVRWRYMDDETQNPMLREGDEIEVVPSDKEGPVVGISTGAGDRTDIPYRTGDNALLLVRAGALQLEPGIRVEIKRVGAGGIETVSLTGADSTALAAVAIHPGDYLVAVDERVRASTGPETGLVEVQGAIARRGMYPIVPGVTHLSEVLNAAGGPTGDAALNGAYIVRKIDRGESPIVDVKTDPAAIMSTSGLSLDDTTRLARDLITQASRVSVDMDGLVRRGDQTRDVTLRDGDRIVIPVSPKHVEIYGRVVFPGVVDYTAGAMLPYYIDRVGGYTESADDSRVQLIRFGTGIWVEAKSATILPGDIVYVPGERDAPARTPLEVSYTVIAIAGAVASIAYTIVLIIQALNRN